LEQNHNPNLENPNFVALVISGEKKSTALLGTWGKTYYPTVLPVQQLLCQGMDNKSNFSYVAMFYLVMSIWNFQTSL
jgi:hypothetical protein